jgi:DNA-binding PadR family transcriptional regulator
MKSIQHLGSQPVSLPLSADQVLEFHAARLLLLLNYCGISGRVDGLTKLAKLDFFARYPDFYSVAKASQGTVEPAPSNSAVESAMIRHHYGPWDKRYYQILAYLEARGLIEVVKKGNGYRITLTEMGQERAKALAARPSFGPLIERMRDIKGTFGNRSGNTLKNLIYKLFDEEVGKRRLGQVIRR